MPPLNRNQLSCLWFGVLLIVAMGLMPPWREATAARNLLGYAPIYNPPLATLTSGVTIDFSRLVVEWILALVLTGGLIATFQQEGQQDAQQEVRRDAQRDDEPGMQPGNKQGNKQGMQQGMQQGSEGSDSRILEPSGERTAMDKAQTLPKAGINEGSRHTASSQSQSQFQTQSQPQQAAPAEPKGPSLHFPQEAIGELLVESVDDPEYWESYSAAAGKVALPQGKRLQLEVEKNETVDLHKLESLPQDAFFSIDLSSSKVTDSDLKAIGRFVGLRELDLSDTLITDVGIKNLSALTNLQKIWLDNTRVTDKGLADLAKHTELIKISVVGTQINEPEVDALAGAFQQKCDVVLGGDS